MGVKETITSGLEALVKKAEERRISERAREISPKIIGVGAALASLYLLKDSSIVTKEFGKIYEFPHWFKFVESATLGYFAHAISNRIAYNFLFRTQDKNIEDLVEESKDSHKEKTIIGRIKNSIGQLRNPLTWAVEHPKTTSFLSTLPALYNLVVKTFYENVYKLWGYRKLFEEHKYEIIAKNGQEHYDKLLDDSKKVIDATLSQQLPVGLLIYMGTYASIALGLTIANIFINPKYGKSSRKRLKAAFISKNYDKASKLLKEAIELMPVRGAYFQLARLQMQHGMVDFAIRSYSEGMKIANKKSPYDDFLRIITIASNPHIQLYKKYTKGIRKDLDNDSNYINLATLHWGLPSRHMAFSVMEEAEKKCEKSPQTRFLHGEMLELAGRKEEAEQKYREGGIILLQNQDISQNFNLIGDFRNEVFTHKFDRYIQNLIAIKRNKDASKLRIEKEQILALKPVFGDRISDFLCDFREGDFNYLLLRYIDGKNLYQFLTEKGSQEKGIFGHIEEYTSLVIEIEKRGMLLYKDGRIDLQNPLAKTDDYFLKKVRYAISMAEKSDIVLTKNETDTIIEGFYYISLPLYSLPRRFYTDNNLRNGMVNGKVRKIDFENNDLLPPVYFFVNICEFGSEFFDEYEKEKIKSIYWADEYDLFNPLLPFFAAQRHMEMVGYMCRDIATLKIKRKSFDIALKERRYHFQKMMQYSQEVLSKGVRYEKIVGKKGLDSIEMMMPALSSISKRL